MRIAGGGALGAGVGRGAGAGAMRIAGEGALGAGAGRGAGAGWRCSRSWNLADCVGVGVVVNYLVGNWIKAESDVTC